MDKVRSAAKYKKLFSFVRELFLQKIRVNIFISHLVVEGSLSELNQHP